MDDVPDQVKDNVESLNRVGQSTQEVVADEIQVSTPKNSGQGNGLLRLGIPVVALLVTAAIAFVLYRKRRQNAPDAGTASSSRLPSWMPWRQPQSVPAPDRMTRVQGAASAARDRARTLARRSSTQPDAPPATRRQRLAGTLRAARPVKRP